MSQSFAVRAAEIAISETSLIVELQDARVLSVPLAWFPDLAKATPAELADHRLIGDGLGIHFESLGIDLSVRGLLIDTPPASAALPPRSHARQPGEPTRVTYHIVPTDDEWRLKRQGESHYTSFETKSEAIRAGVTEARTHEAGQLIIHKQNGQFQEERTYGNDPTKIPG